MTIPRLPLVLAVGLTLLARSLPAAETPPPRADPAATWDLTLLYADDAAWRAAKDRVAAGIPRIKEFEGKLGQSPATLFAAMDYVQKLREEFIRLSVYASLNRDQDTRQAAALERSQEIGLLGTQFSRTTSFIDPELLAVGETWDPLESTCRHASLSIL